MRLHDSAIRTIPANEDGRGNLAGFGARCTDCPWTATNTFRWNVEQDARDHSNWAIQNDRAAERRLRRLGVR